VRSSRLCAFAFLELRVRPQRSGVEDTNNPSRLWGGVEQGLLRLVVYEGNYIVTLEVFPASEVGQLYEEDQCGYLAAELLD
jgi:hypothetical protein